VSLYVHFYESEGIHMDIATQGLPDPDKTHRTLVYLTGLLMGLYDRKGRCTANLFLSLQHLDVEQRGHTLPRYRPASRYRTLTQAPGPGTALCLSNCAGSRSAAGPDLLQVVSQWEKPSDLIQWQRGSMRQRPCCCCCRVPGQGLEEAPVEAIPRLWGCWRPP
jgi:hypothetical protein